MMQSLVQPRSESTPGASVSAEKQSGGKGGDKGFGALLLSLFGGSGAKVLDEADENLLLKGEAKEGSAGKGKGTSLFGGLKSKGLGAVTAANEKSETTGEDVAELGLPLIALTPSAAGLVPSSNTTSLLAQGSMAGETPQGETLSFAGLIPEDAAGKKPGMVGGTPVKGEAKKETADLTVDKFASLLRGDIEKKAAGPSTKGKAATGEASRTTALQGPGTEPLTQDVLQPTTLAAASPAKVGGSMAQAGDTSTPSLQGLATGETAAILAAGSKGTAKTMAPKDLADSKGGKESFTPPTSSVDGAPRLTAAQAAATERMAPVQPIAGGASSLTGDLRTIEVEENAAPSGLSKRLALQVGRQIATSIKRNENEVVFQVRPPSLGRIQMRIEKEGDRISVRIISEKETSGELMAAGKGELRALLVDHGIRVDRIEVEQGSSAQFAQQGGGDARDGRQRSNGSDGDRTAQHGGRDAPDIPDDPGRRHEGAISITA